MIKKLKIGLLTFVMLFAFGVAVEVNAQALTYSNDTEVLIDGRQYLIAADSEATSVIINATTLVVEVPASSTFTLKSLSGHTLANEDGGAIVTAQTCSGATTSVAYTGAGTITFTPTTDVECVDTSGTGGGSGGGGSSSSIPATPATPAVPATPGEIPGCGNRTTGFSSATGASCVGNTSTTPATPASPALGASAYNFGTTTLKNGSTGEAVKELQRFLNATMGLGLVVDGMFGPHTTSVMKQWQTSHGLLADGLIGPLTKAQMHASVGATAPATPAAPSAPVAPSAMGSYNFGTAVLKNGSTGEAVKELQRFLNAKLNLGLAVDGALGPLTIEVIKQWQADNGLVADGLVGPATKAIMNAQ